jgi:hypothetical protein
VMSLGSSASGADLDTRYGAALKASILSLNHKYESGRGSPMRFDEQSRDKYTLTTDRGGYVGTIERVGERFAFMDARHLRPACAELIAVYADELQKIVDKLKQLDAKKTD